MTASGGNAKDECHCDGEPTAMITWPLPLGIQVTQFAGRARTPLLSSSTRDSSSMTITIIHSLLGEPVPRASAPRIPLEHLDPNQPERAQHSVAEPPRLHMHVHMRHLLEGRRTNGVPHTHALGSIAR